MCTTFMLFSCNFGTWWWPFIVWNVLNCMEKSTVKSQIKMIFTEFAYFLVKGSFKTMLYIGIVYIIVYWNKPSMGILNRHLCINNEWLLIVLMSVWRYNEIFWMNHFFSFVFINGLGRHRRDLYMNITLCLHRTSDSFISKEQWKYEMKCFQVPFKPTQPDRAVSARAGDIHSCRISVNSERAECSRDSKCSSFGSWIKVWKWRASWLSCKYSQPSTDQEKSLASISHSFPFFLSFSFFFFLTSD